MTVTFIIDNVVYILDDIDMLPGLADRTTTMSTMGQKTDQYVDGGLGAEKMDNAFDTRLERAADKPKLRILFVEDNDYVRDLTVCLLEGQGREVVAFSSAEEALREFQRRPFDLVITDVSLPLMSGIELAKRVLSIAPRVWLIIASGYQLPPGIEKLGAHVRAMTKPFESDRIEAVLSQFRASSAGALTH